jgi:flagellar hook-basal body complex protein FliE
MQRFMRGEPVELHQVMAAAEESGIALEMLVELRNKFTEAYRTLVNMQS